MTEEEKAAAAAAESAKTAEPEKKEEVVSDREEILLGTGEKLALTKDEQRYLLQIGVEAYRKSKETTPPKDDKESDKEADVDEKALDKKVDTLLKEFAAMRQEQQDEKQQQSLKTIRNNIENEIKECIEGHELTRGDKDMAESARALVVNRLVASPGITVKDAFKKEIKIFENVKNKYVSDKKEDREKTRGAGKGGAAASGEPTKMTGSDLLSGKLRKSVTAKLNDINRKANRF